MPRWPAGQRVDIPAGTRHAVGFRWSCTTTYARFTEKRLVVCEVKTRSGTEYGEPSEGVTPAKAARIRRVTAAWLRTYRVGWCEVRFDVLAVLCPQDGPVTVEHLRVAF